MVMVNTEEDNGVIISEEESLSREKRKRTGRYVAAGTAIFLSILGVYQALIRGTPEYAALFAPAVIMFMYVLWILHTSRHQYARRLLRLKQSAASTELLKVAVEPDNFPEKIGFVSNNFPMDEDVNNVETVSSSIISNSNNKPYFNRSYSIA